MEPSSAGAFTRLGKRSAPPLASLVNLGPVRNAVRLATIYLEILQGKGSGTGWDMAGEVTAAMHFLKAVPDPVIVDIGANHGDWTGGIWKALGRGRYFAFEPQEACLASIRAQNVPGLTITRSAVADQPGEMELHSDAAGSGLASLYVRGESYLDKPTRTEQVPVTTVDLALAEHGLDHVDFMKIDVEGAEFEVLRGAEQALKTQAISAFSFEFGSANIYSRVFFKDCWDLITGFGYTLWRIVPGGRPVPVPAYREDLEHFRGVSNYIGSVATRI